MTRRSPAEIAALNAAQAKSAAPPEPIMVTVQGPRGETGIQGVQGPTGPRGPVGVTGATGPLGPIGDTGPLGPKGAVGPVGPKGPVGAVGPAGQDGVGPDEKVKLDASDPEAGYLEAKLQPGLNVKFRRSKNGKALVIDATGGGAAISTGGGRGPAGPQGPPGPQGEPGTGGPGSDDQTAAEVPFTPNGSISATNVQAAIQEVRDEAGTGTQTLAEVLLEGNDPGGTAIQGATVDGGTGGTVEILPALAGGEGGPVEIYGGDGIAGQKGGDILVYAGQGNASGGQTGSQITVHGGKDDGTGADLEVEAGAGDLDGAGGTLRLVGGKGNAQAIGTGPRFAFTGNTSAGAGGPIDATAGEGDVGQPGGELNLAAGTGNAGASLGGALNLTGGDDTTTPGRVGIYTDGTTGDLGDVFTAQGDGTAIWGSLIRIKQTSAPADGDIPASQVFLWFDDTDGATALMVKGKSADGTVVTATVPLT